MKRKLRNPEKESEMRALRNRFKRIGLINHLEDISKFCFDEAEHVRRQWADPQFANVWARRGELVYQVAQGLRKEELRGTVQIQPKPILPLKRIPFFRRDK